MKKAVAIFVLLLICVFALAETTKQQEPVVSVTGGELRGRALDAPGGAVFLGVPFAQPPVGKLRWHEPVPVVPWTGMRMAVEFKPACSQVDAGWNHNTAIRGAEDCLYLNVWAPEWPSKAPKAVMVWFHGGANMGGTASYGYDGSSLARHGVVVVTVNYRLGVLGFMAHPELTAESAHHSSGNYALLDQIAALRWVHENIAKFGGDPRRVTIFGQSAGAQDVGLLMTSSLTNGLFQRAIAESGTVLVSGPELRTMADAERSGEAYAAKLKAPATKQIAFLRTLPVGDLIKASPAYGSHEVGPSVDPWVLPEQPAAIFAKGKEHKVDLIMGDNAIEFPFGGDTNALKEVVGKAYGNAAPKALALYGLDGAARDAGYPLHGDARAQWSSDVAFRCPAIVIADQHHAAGNKVYQYEFSLPLIGTKDAAHSAELPYVWGEMTPAKFHAKEVPAADMKVSEEMQQYWTNFAKTGDPNGGSLMAWPAYDSNSRKYIEFTTGATLAKSNLRRAQCELFAEWLKSGAAK